MAAISSTLAYSPQATAASMAPPMEGPSSLSGTSTLRFSTRAVFIGMSMDTTRADMTQAVLEGVAFALRDSLEVAKSLAL